jgi:DNA polymerase
MDKEFLLADLESRYVNCQRCPELAAQRLESLRDVDRNNKPYPGGKIVFGYGNPDADIMIIGECPGYEEDHVGIPFVGRSGQLLDQFLLNVLEISDIRSRDTNIYITNTTLCMPPLHTRTNPTSQEMSNCYDRLIEQIMIVDPIAILVMGGKALGTFFGNKKKISEARGRFCAIQFSLCIIHPSCCAIR